LEDTVLTAVVTKAGFDFGFSPTPLSAKADVVATEKAIEQIARTVRWVKSIRKVPS